MSMIALKEYGQKLPPEEFYQTMWTKSSSGGLFALMHNRNNSPEDVTLLEATNKIDYEKLVKILRENDNEDTLIAHSFISVHSTGKPTIEVEFTHTVENQDTAETLCILGEGDFKSVRVKNEYNGIKSFTKFLFQTFGDSMMPIPDIKKFINRLLGVGDSYLVFASNGKKKKVKTIHNLSLDEQYNIYLSNDTYLDSLTLDEKTFIKSIATFISFQNPENEKTAKDLFGSFSGLTDKEYRDIVKKFNIPSIK